MIERLKEKYSRSQVLNYAHLDRKYSDNDNRVQKRKEFSDEITEDEAEEDEVDEIRREKGAAMQKVNAKRNEDEGGHEHEQRDAQIGKCAICHVIVDDTNFGRSVADSEQDPRCSESYLLCQRCVRKLTVRSGR